MDKETRKKLEDLAKMNSNPFADQNQLRKAKEGIEWLNIFEWKKEDFELYDKAKK